MSTEVLMRKHGKSKPYKIPFDLEYMTFSEMEEFIKDIREEFPQYSEFSFDYEIEYDYGYSDGYKQWYVYGTKNE